MALYLEGGLASEASEDIRDHLDACDACREVVTTLVKTSVPAEPEALSAVPLPPGTVLGRYILLQLVGSGGMGVVYAAYDPELDRKVALKLVRPELTTTLELSGRAQLLAEAKAVARLSHPNVVTVYDVGTYAEQVFFAMEFIKGSTLRGALEDKAPWRARLAWLTAAGRGLAAAHAAGLVHRDFKPENVLVGDDGRICVTDFGFAARSSARPAVLERVGTPAYMAPEQWRGEAFDARADQYAFGMTCAEALFGARPAPDASVPPGAPGIPPEVGAVLARGCAPDPEARWESMEALLEALARAARPWTRRGLGMTLAMVALAATLWVHREVVREQAARELSDRAARIQQRLSAHQALMNLRIQTALQSGPILEAFEHASDADAALGLAPHDDHDQALTEAHELMRSADLSGLKSEDLLLMVNAWGKVVFDLAAEARFGEPAPAVPLLTRTMQGQSGVELWSSTQLSSWQRPLLTAPHPDDLLLVFARPVIRGESLVGVVLAGHSLGREVLPELGRASGLQIWVQMADGGRAGVGVPEERLPALREVQYLTRGGARLAVLALPFPEKSEAFPGATFFVVQSLGEEKARAGAAEEVARWLSLALALWAAVALGYRAWRYA